MSKRKIAALYVHSRGHYIGLPGVDPWDVKRDAKGYPGPHPVVAHPPCQRWCMLARLNYKIFGYKVGDDQGTFKHALKMVRRYGGVLEHPAFSLAWPKFGLTVPVHGLWTRAGRRSWVTQVSLRAYGHRARKLTWLYYVGDADPPELDWSRPKATAQIGYVKDRENNPGTVTRLEAITTPPRFRDVLIKMARAA